MKNLSIEKYNQGLQRIPSMVMKVSSARKYPAS